MEPQNKERQPEAPRNGFLGPGPHPEPIRGALVPTPVWHVTRSGPFEGPRVVELTKVPLLCIPICVSVFNETGTTTEFSGVHCAFVCSVTMGWPCTWWQESRRSVIHSPLELCPVAPVLRAPGAAGLRPEGPHVTGQT